MKGEHRHLEDLQEERYEGKFWVYLDGVRRVPAYFIEAAPRVVVKIDGEHTYLWYRSGRLSPTVTLIGD